MSDIQELRTRLAEKLVADTRALSDAQELSRDSLDNIRSQLQMLAAKRELWSEADFPPPAEGELQNRYLIADEPGGGISLYLNVVRSGKRVPPHDHTTWACIAAVEGVEHNLFYTRTDDGAIEGKATLKMDRVVAVGPGDAIAMMPDDIHNFEVRGDQTIRHLHFYGRPLESLSERKAFDMEKGTYKIMDVGVKTIT
ncbi:MAG: cysteine dioxygenase family protein [Woeseiaceae bacterium]|jgi:predicted metal-dependent enzyme (double-stranded beta helix superfamily)|nr:cysteine dioxygenase family protein [Woeseiaceae bacterium]